MKITYVISSMATTGGTERMIAEKVNYLSEHYGYDIIIISCYQRQNEDNYFYTSKRVKQINLGIPYYSQYKYKHPKRIWIKWKIIIQLRRSINKTVKQVDPDILIGVSRFMANYVSSIKCRAKKIIECHEAKYNTLYNVGEYRSFSARFFMKIYSHIYFREIERNADAIVTLTEEDKMLWKRAKYSEVIPNFSTMPISKYSDCTPKRIIAVGRLEWEKGFGRLIEIWRIVSSKHTDWQLVICGEGNMYNTIKALIKIYNARNVTIQNFTPNISEEYAVSSICAVTSYYEGFSLVILEAMKHGVPCVAFDCPFGPRSIISDASCGFLVENGDTKLFADRICRLIEDKHMRREFSSAAIERAKHFDTDKIMNKWKVLLEQITL